LPGGTWQYGDSIFLLCQIGKLDRWIFRNSIPCAPQASVLCEDEIGRKLLERVHDKIEKAPKYDWTDPLFLLVRNTYQAFSPPKSLLEELRSKLAESVFQRAWLVSKKEGTIDADPPEPRLIDLMP
jgi:hypothetical protein